MPRPARRTKKLPASCASKKGDSVTSNEASDVSMVDDDIIPSYLHAHKPGDPDNVRKILKFGIPGYKAAKDHTTSRSTRGPAYYDKHLDKLLRPAKVAYCPGLNLQIEEIADRYYQKYLEKFGPPPKCDSTNPADVRQTLYQYGAPKVKLENGIVHHYAKVVPDITLPIVSALAFETPSWWTRYLQWSTTEQSMDKAIADAALRVDLDFPPPGSTHHDCPYAPVERGNRRPLLGETAVRGEMSMFNCPVCDDPSRKELKDVVDYFPCVTLYEFKNLLAGRYEHMIAMLDMTCDDDVHWEECDRQTCAHDNIDFRVTGSRNGFDAANPIVQLKAADWTQTQVELEDGHRSSAKRILQQIWSELVKNDATFLVLSCGNIDMIAARSRSERVLYLGDPIFTTKPGYIGMLVGLSIASIRDAIDRGAQLRACENANNLPSSWTKYTEDDHVKNDDPDLGPLDFTQMLRECRKLSLIPKRGCGVQKRRGNLYKRYPKQGSDSRGLKIRIEPIDEDENIFIGLVKWKKRLFKERFIVKTAQGKHAVQKLARESCVFRSLMGDPESCKIPFMYGFFVDVPKKPGIPPHAVIIQQYVGNQLSKRQFQSRKNSVTDALEHIRKRGYEYDGVDERSLVARTKKNGEAEVYLVGLSRFKALKTERSGARGPFSALDRGFRRRTDGPPIYLGPIRDNTIPPVQAFNQITLWAWMSPGQTTFPITARCIGWVDTLPDYLEIGIPSADVDQFDEVWERRPDVLRGIECLRMGAWS